MSADLSKVTRVTVVSRKTDPNRVYEGTGLYDHGVILLLQDDGRTLKILPAEEKGN